MHLPAWPFFLQFLPFINFFAFFTSTAGSYQLNHFFWLTVFHHINILVCHYKNYDNICYFQARSTKMITYDELNIQNHSITELSNVLLYLFKDRSMCDTGACCELFHRFVDKVNAHIDLVDKNLYVDLLNDSDPEVRNLVKNFMSGSQEIKKLIHTYTRQWCPRKRPDELLIGDHERFLVETEGMFDMILQRIQDETEKLYPLIRKTSGDLDTAA